MAGSSEASEPRLPADTLRRVDIVPVPDPTALTTAALYREIDALAARTTVGRESLRELLETRLDGMDKAITLLQTSTDRMPDFVRGEVSHLDKLHSERFDSITAQTRVRFEGIETQFVERDKRTEQLSLADKTAIAAALQAQKEAAGSTNESNAVALSKMEGNFTKLIDQGQVLIAAVVKNTDEKINDIKGRLDRGEGKTSVSDPATSEALRLLAVAVGGLGQSHDSDRGRQRGMADIGGWIAGGVGMLVAIITMVALVISVIPPHPLLAVPAPITHTP